MKKNFELWVCSHPTQKKLIMELKIAFLIIVTSISGALAAPSYSQVTKVSLDMKGTTLEQVMDEIERQSEFYFIFNQKQIDVDRVVDVQAENKLITDVLPELFGGTNVNFAVLDRKILLTTEPLEKGIISRETEKELQQKQITGTVTDEKGSPLPGVTVMVKGTAIGSLTDASGKYTINNPPQNAILVFSFVGMAAQEIPSEGRIRIDITLKEEAIGLDEVVVVGYGIQKKINLTGAVAQVTSERLENRPVSNISQALQGVAPGLNITPSSLLGGEPGAEMSYNIRGIGSLSGGAPYVLVDGLPMDLNNVNPEDIETISILKDAASSAIYGSRAPYGVILITTKSGKKDEKIEVDYSSGFLWSAPTELPGFVNSLDFAKSFNEAGINSGQSPLFSDETIGRIIKFQEDPENTPAMIPDPKDPNGWGYWNLANGNTDWYDVYFKDWAFSQRHNLGITGGSKKTTYYVGLGWLDEGGKINFVNEKYQRASLSSNISIDATDWLTISLKSKFAYGYNNYAKPTTVQPIGASATARTALLGMFARQWPVLPVRTPNGDLAMDLVQVCGLVNGGSDKKYSSDLWLNPSIVFKLSNNWKINADFGYNQSGFKETNFTAIITGLAVDGFTIVKHYSQNYNSIKQDLSQSNYYTSNIYSTFEKRFNDHFFGILLGGQAELNKYTDLIGWRRDLVSESVPSISTAVGDKDVKDAMSHWSTLGTFMRINYNYNEKYLLEINGRYDGSSRFQKGRRWGFFPSLSLGYNIWKENFFVPVKNIINTLKLRASYGNLGNQNVANYLHIETLPIRTNLTWIIDGKRPVYTTTPSNTSLGLTWEESKTTDLGLDVGMLDDRLNFTFDWFNRKTENMFGPGETLPAVLGTSVPRKNNATLETKGVELSIGWRQSITDDLKYNLTLVFSDNKSVVKEYNNPTKYIYNYYKGQTIGEIWGYESTELFKSDEEATAWVDQTQLYKKWSAGDVKYIDINGDGKITRGSQTVDDPGDLKVIGNTSPRYLFGINLNANYKWFDLSMFWQGVGKKDAWIDNVAFWGFMTSFPMSSLQAHNINYWSPNNTGAYYPKPYLTTENTKNRQPQTRYLQDASYIRFKDLQLGYTLPSAITKKINIEKARFYFSGENLFTFSGIMKTFDPESPSGALVYPLSRTLAVGVNITF